MRRLPDAVRALLAAPNYAHIATIMPDGGPHSVPVWVDLEGDRIVVLTDSRSRKALNIERDPRITISITDRGNPNRMAQVRRRVVERVDHAGQEDSLAA